MTGERAVPLINPAWPEVAAVVADSAMPLPAPAERVPLTSSIGRVLAEDLAARTSVPGFTSSAMDGWAVSGAGPWQIVGESAAGTPYTKELVPGTAVHVATGAATPDGASGIVRLEDGKQAHGVISASDQAPRALDFRRAGEEVTPGELLAKSGTTVSPPLAGLAAAAAHDELVVRPQPSVDVVLLGDELVHQGVPPAGAIRDALGVQLPAWVAAFGGNTAAVTHVNDTLDATCSALAAAVADVVVTTGGTSVGSRDHVRAAVDELGGQVVVDGVSVRPGHPMLLATLPESRWLVGLPGNPGAAIAAVLTLLRPLLAALLGISPRCHAVVATAADIPAGRTHRLVPGLVHDGVAVPVAGCGSARLTGWAAASHALIVPPHGLGAQSSLPALPLPWA